MALQLSVVRTAFLKLAKARVSSASLGISAVTKQSIRTYASEADPEDYGYFPDPTESLDIEKKQLIARLQGDDRYEPKVYYRADVSTFDDPNLVPCAYQNRVNMTLVCFYDDGKFVDILVKWPYLGYANFWVIRKGHPKRCECGHWFKAVDVEGDLF